MNTDKQIIDLQSLQDDITKWQIDTFGPSWDQALRHLQSEVDEVLADPDDISEYADLLIPLLGSAGQRGYSVADLIKAAVDKMIINKTREWGPVNDRGFREHIKG